MRAEDPWQKLPLFFMFTMLIHACCANSDTIFQVSKVRIKLSFTHFITLVVYLLLRTLLGNLRLGSRKSQPYQHDLLDCLYCRKIQWNLRRKKV